MVFDQALTDIDVSMKLVQNPGWSCAHSRDFSRSRGRICSHVSHLHQVRFAEFSKPLTDRARNAFSLGLLWCLQSEGTVLASSTTTVETKITAISNPTLIQPFILLYFGGSGARSPSSNLIICFRSEEAGVESPLVHQIFYLAILPEPRESDPRL